MAEILKPTPDMLPRQPGFGTPSSDVPFSDTLPEPTQDNRVISITRSYSYQYPILKKPIMDEFGNIVGTHMESTSAVGFEIISGGVDKLTERFAKIHGITRTDDIEELRNSLIMEHESRKKQQESAEQKRQAQRDIRRRLKIEKKWGILSTQHPTIKSDIEELLEVIDKEGGAIIKWDDDPHPDTYMKHLRNGLLLSSNHFNLQLWKLPNKPLAKVVKVRGFST